MGSLSSDGSPDPSGARRSSGRGDRTLNVSLCAAGGSVRASPRSRARDSIHDEHSAVGPLYCNTFCSVVRLPYSITYRFAHCITYSIAYSIAYCFAYRFPLGIAVPLGEGRARLLRSHQPVLLLCFFIHRGAWKSHSRKLSFCFTEC